MYPLLQPRKFRFQTTQKNRKCYKFKLMVLRYGQYGLRLLQPLRITARHIFRYKMIFKKATKRSEKTLRTYWITLFPNQPITRKSKGSRMGKGKGKRQTWGTVIVGGSIFIEFRNTRYGRGLYYLIQIQRRLGVESRIIAANFLPVARYRYI